MSDQIDASAPVFASWTTVVLLMLVAVSYSPLVSAGFIWDDDDYVTKNRCLRTFSGLWQIWFQPGATPQYYPLVFTTFWVEYQLWNLSPLGYHVDNVLLHGLNAVLLFWILHAIRLPGAFFAAALFAVHPVHVESVAWMTERKNVLSGLFYLIAFLAYWKFVQTEPSEPTRRWRLYGLAILGNVFALLAKSVTCSLPAALFLVLWWKQGRLTRQQILSLVPMFVIGLAAGIHTAYFESQHVGAKGLEWNWTFWERCLIAGRAVWFYAAKLVWPSPLIFIYPKWSVDVLDGWQALAPLSAFVLMLCLIAGRRFWGRGPLVAALYFGGTLLPALGFVNVYPMRYSFVADHFQYLASIGLIALVAALAMSLARRWKLAEMQSSLLASGIILALGLVSFLRCFDYQDREALWTATVADNPNCWMAECHLAAVRFEQSRFQEAVELFQLSISHRPANEPDPDELAEAQGYLGDCYLALGDSASARQHFLAALAHFERLIQADTDSSGTLHNNVAILRGKLGEYDNAYVEFQKALDVDPDSPEIIQSLGELCFRLKRFEESASCFQRVLKIDPKNVRAHYNLGVLSVTEKNWPQARQHLQTVLKLQPDFPAARQILSQIPAG